VWVLPKFRSAVVSSLNCGESLCYVLDPIYRQNPWLYMQYIYALVCAQITKLKIDSNPFAKGFRDSVRLGNEPDRCSTYVRCYILRISEKLKITVLFDFLFFSLQSQHFTYCIYVILSKPLTITSLRTYTARKFQTQNIGKHRLQFIESLFLNKN